jgi:hypothetical protein
VSALYMCSTSLKQYSSTHLLSTVGCGAYSISIILMGSNGRLYLFTLSHKLCTGMVSDRLAGWETECETTLVGLWGSVCVSVFSSQVPLLNQCGTGSGVGVALHLEILERVIISVVFFDGTCT